MLKKLLITSLLISSATFSSLSIAADNNLLNVSYDVTREFYKDFNAAFIKYWKDKTGAAITINQSHGGSSKQARSVNDGLEADIVTMNQSPDIDILYTRGKLIPKDWQSACLTQAHRQAQPQCFWYAKATLSKLKIGMT